MNKLSDYILEESADDARGQFDRPKIVLNGQFANAVVDISSKLAEKHYETILEVDNDHWPTHNNYATLLKNLDGRAEEAEKHYRRALVLTSPTDNSLESDFAEAHNNYAILLSDLEGRTEKAKKHYHRALILTSPTDDPLEPDFAEAHYNYASFSEMESNLLKAKKHSERSVELWIRRDRYRKALSDSRLLVRVSERLGKEQDAIDYCQRALRIAERHGFPDHHPIVRELRELCSV